MNKMNKSHKQNRYVKLSIFCSFFFFFSHFGVSINEQVFLSRKMFFKKGTKLGTKRHWHAGFYNIDGIPGILSSISRESRCSPLRPPIYIYYYNTFFMRFIFFMELDEEYKTSVSHLRKISNLYEEAYDVLEKVALGTSIMMDEYKDKLDELGELLKEDKGIKK